MVGAFEQGPIRPPSEAGSLLIRVTRNCPWNKCAFCNVYKGKRFELREIEEIKQDILNAKRMAEEVKALSWRLGFAGRITQGVLTHVYNHYGGEYLGVALWLARGGETVFLQDANSLILKTPALVEILGFLKSEFPEVKRITTYARAKTLAQKKEEELLALRTAGLSRIHVGLETGYDPLLALMRKGVTAREQIEGGQKAKAAGISLSEYVILGLGGKRWSREHALATAAVLNAINPDFIRLRTLALKKNAPLYGMFCQGEFEPLPEDEVIKEERLFIENLNGITSMVVSDHAFNLLEEAEGKLPHEKGKMLAVIDAYLGLPERERLLFRLGRRASLCRSLAELRHPPLRSRLKAIFARLEQRNQVEETITALQAQFL